MKILINSHDGSFGAFIVLTEWSVDVDFLVKQNIRRGGGRTGMEILWSFTQVKVQKFLHTLNVAAILRGLSC